MLALYPVMGDALLKAGRPILYSLCQYGRAEVWKWGADVGGNAWRTTGDIRDTWDSMTNIGHGVPGVADVARGAPGIATYIGTPLPHFSAAILAEAVQDGTPSFEKRIAHDWI